MGHNFIDPIPLDDRPAMVEIGESLAGASLTSKFQTTMMFPGVSSAVFDVYVEYVPRLVPRAPHHPGSQVLGSMLLGEHNNTLCLLVVCLCL